MMGLERLRQLEELRRWLQTADTVLGQLTPEERLILQQLVLEPQQGNASALCQLLEVEIATLYRKRRRLLDKLKPLDIETATP